MLRVSGSMSMSFLDRSMRTDPSPGGGACIAAYPIPGRGGTRSEACFYTFSDSLISEAACRERL